MAFHFGHIHLLSLDPDAAAAFYCEHFGARIARRYPAMAGALNLCLKLGHLSLYIRGVRPTDRMAAPCDGKHPGMDHFGLDVDDFDAVIERLAKANVPCLDGPWNLVGYRVAFFQCPDNVVVQISEMIDGHRPSEP